MKEVKDRIMQKITMFYMQGCPYCAQANRALGELAEEDPSYGQIEIEKIDEDAHPDVANQYDYYNVPAMFIGSRKLYEAHPGESYEECRAHVKAVLDAAEG